MVALASHARGRWFETTRAHKAPGIDFFRKCSVVGLAGRDSFSQVQVNYKLALNVLGVAIFAAPLWLTARRGATDPVCVRKVDRAKAVTKELAGESYYFCSEHCLRAFEAQSQTGASPCPSTRDRRGTADRPTDRRCAPA
jgi:YHS domain-containing protein